MGSLGVVVVGEFVQESLQVVQGCGRAWGEPLLQGLVDALDPDQFSGQFRLGNPVAGTAAVTSVSNAANLHWTPSGDSDAARNRGKHVVRHSMRYPWQPAVRGPAAWST